MKVILNVRLRGATIAMMATVRLGLEARQLQEMSGRKGRWHQRGFAETMVPIETLLTSLVLQ
jgi:hypothetical protein